MVLGRDEAWKDIDSAGGDREIVIAAAVFLSTVLENAQAPPLGAVGRRKLFKPDDSVRDAVNRLVGRFRRQVIEQQDRGAVAREIMLDREQLAAIAQGTLRQQPNFGKTVEHHAL